jgi:23S rRNA (cytidine2498-2'-O)-methyltransferase
VLASPFVFVTCQPGAESALKRELGELRPDWAPAYQRPGLVTLRSARALGPELALDAVFARVHGLSLGQATDSAAACERIATLPAPVCLQVFEREPRDPDDAAPSEGVRTLEQELRAKLGERVTASNVARIGELVVSVVVGRGDPLLIGCHRHDASRVPHPGARFPLALPAAAPSRAYLKIEEAIRTFGLPVRAGDTALEIGAAPGGAAYALRERGVRVFAVDPAAMDEALLNKAGPSGAKVLHLPVSMRELRRDQLPGRVDWLLIDVHLAPQIAMRAARRLASELRPTLVGAVVTLKLNDWSFAPRIGAFVRQAAEMGIVEPRAKQLPAHRQELALVGLTARGVRRV